MPIKAKFREKMRRLKTNRFVIRFWFSYDVPSCGGRMAAFGDLVNKLSPDRTPEDVELLASSFFEEHDSIAAMEVLSAATHNGIVAYYEWP